MKDELKTKSGLLIAGHDFEVTATFLTRVKNIDPPLLNKVVKVRDPCQTKPESG